MHIFFSSCPSALPLSSSPFGVDIPRRNNAFIQGLRLCKRICTFCFAKAIAIANARARGFASRTSEVLCKNDLGRVQSASEARLSSWRYYAIAILGFLTFWRNGPVSAPINHTSNHEHLAAVARTFCESCKSSRLHMLKVNRFRKSKIFNELNLYKYIIKIRSITYVLSTFIIILYKVICFFILSVNVFIILISNS